MSVPQSKLGNSVDMSPWQLYRWDSFVVTVSWRVIQLHSDGRQNHCSWGCLIPTTPDRPQSARLCGCPVNKNSGFSAADLAYPVVSLRGTLLRSSLRFQRNRSLLKQWIIVQECLISVDMPLKQPLIRAHQRWDSASCSGLWLVKSGRYLCCGRVFTEFWPQRGEQHPGPGSSVAGRSETKMSDILCRWLNEELRLSQVVGESDQSSLYTYKWAKSTVGKTRKTSKSG